MKLFEGGILDKITSDEYERMFQSMQAVNSFDNDDGESESESVSNDNKKAQNVETAGGKSKVKTSSEKELTALSLQMLQGAFYLALIGYILAFLVLLVEIGCERINWRATLCHISKRLRARMMRINRFRL